MTAFPEEAIPAFPTFPSRPTGTTFPAITTFPAEEAIAACTAIPAGKGSGTAATVPAATPCLVSTGTHTPSATGLSIVTELLVLATPSAACQPPHGTSAITARAAVAPAATAAALLAGAATAAFATTATFLAGAAVLSLAAISSTAASSGFPATAAAEPSRQGWPAVFAVLARREHYVGGHGSCSWQWGE
jgi:hypothetical protein